MGEWMKWMCYVDIAIVLILSAYAGIIKKNATRREKVFCSLWVIWGILGFFALEFTFNDKFYAVPKTFLLVSLTWTLYIVFSGRCKRKHEYISFALYAATVFGYIVVASVGGPGIEVYTRDEVARTIKLAKAYDTVPVDAYIPFGVDDDEYIFQIDNIMYYYSNLSGKGVTKHGIDVKNIKMVITTEKEDPNIKWYAKKSYYKTLRWGKEIEKKAPVLLAKPPEPFIKEHYVKIFVPPTEDHWVVASSVSTAGD